MCVYTERQCYCFAVHFVCWIYVVLRQTANGKMKLLSSVFSSLNSRVKIFVFVANSRRHFSIFMWFRRIRRKEHKFRGHLCRLPLEVRPRNIKLSLSNGRSHTRGRTNRLDGQIVWHFSVWCEFMSYCRWLVRLDGQIVWEKSSSRRPNICSSKNCSSCFHIRRFVRLRRFVRPDDLFVL